MNLPTTTKYVFLQPFNGIVSFTCFANDKKEIDTFFPCGLQNNVFNELNSLDIILITCENKAVELGLDIYED